MNNFNQPKTEFEILIKKNEEVVSKVALKPNPEIDLVFDAFRLMLQDLGFTEEQINNEISRRYHPY